jgi:hypothetical protein
MATLTAAERKALPDSEFALPDKREYPIHDESHARDALSRVQQDGNAEERRLVYSAVKAKYPEMDVETSP